MKSVLLISFLFLCFTSSAQINAYVFSTNNTTVRDTMAATTIQLVGRNNDDSISALTTFTTLTNGAGFTFSFNGTPYTQFSVSSNGLLQLGARIASIDSSNALTSASFNPKIAPYWDNLHTGLTSGQGQVHCKYIGSSPSRKLVIEWFETVPRNSGVIANAKVQVWLFESTHATVAMRNVIQFVYGNGFVSNTTNAGASVGIANSASDYWSVTTSAHTANSGVVNNNNTAAISYGRSYIFTPPAVPPCATTFAPANGTTGVPALTPTTLSWASGGGVVTGYNVYLDTNATPVTLVSSNQAGTTYTPGALLPNKTYFWKIVPRNTTGPATASCTITSFTTLALAPCATSLSPANGATNQVITTTLSWATGGGTVTGYDVYFGTSSTPPQVATNQPGTTYNPGALLAGTTYWWKIAPRNGSGPATTCSTISFTTLAIPPCATTFAPANGTTGVPALTPTALTWVSGGGTVTGYDVYLDTNATPVTLVSSSQAGTSYTPGALLPNKTYFWRIAPRNSSGAATGCTITSFTTLALAPCAINHSPANGASNQVITTTLSWATGGGTVTGYDVYFGTSSTPPQVATNQPGTTYSPGTLLAGTTYFWKIAPRNGSGPATTCSTISFTTLSVPACATSLSPANGATGQVITTTLSWANGGGTVVGYDVYFGTIAAPPLVSSDQVGTTYNPGILLANTTYFWKIIAKNSSGSASGCSVISFTTLAVPPCATSLSPANGATGQVITTTLSWASGGGTVSGYDVYFGTAGSPPLVSPNQPGTTYNPGTLLANTTYFWQIIPKNSSGSATGCSVISFTTLALPPCATTFAPANGTTGVLALTPTTLSWASGGGTVTGYDVYLDTNATPVTLVSSNQSGTTYAPGALIPNKQYYWKIVPRNSSGPATASCTITSFTTLALPPCAINHSPANGATNQVITTTFSWATGGGTVTGYDVYFGTAGSPPLVMTGQPGTTYNPGTLLANTTYFWKIAPRNGSGPATTCATISFSTLPVPPCATTFAPANGTTGVPALTPTALTWASGGGTVTGYDVYLDTNATPVTLVSSNQAGTTYTPGALLPNKTYFWRIAPRNSSGAVAGCTITSFSTLALPPCATSQSPANGATSQPIATTTLSWATGGGTVTGYDVYFGTAASPPLVVTGQPGTTYNPGTLVANTTYFWKIAPRNGSGPATTCSTISFTTLAVPPCATTFAPANGTTGVPALTPTTLSWASGGGTVTGYDVYLDTLAAPVNLVSSNQAGTTYVPGALIPNKQYYWKIVPKNSSGAATGCTVTSFTTLALPPCAISLSPANAATGQVITTTLSWATGGGTVTGYDVYFGTIASPPLMVTGQPGTTYNPGTLLANTTYFWKIAPRNGSGPATTCSTISFTTLAVPPCATSLSPSNGATSQLITTTLAWATGGGTVTGYDVYFGTAASPPIVVTGQAGTTYNPGTLLANTTYFWKIVPKNSSGTATGCSTFSFITLAVPPCATSLSPANGATGQVITTTLSWATGGGTVTGYDVYFGTATSPPLVVTGQMGTTYNPGTLVANTTYYWKILPKNSSGTATGCSTISFTTLAVPSCATSFSPVNGATGVPALSATLSWANGGGTVTGYDVYLDTLAAPVNLRSSNQAGTTYNAPALQQNRIYYWKIVPRNSSGAATGCAVNSFTTLAVPPCATTFAPVNGTTGVFAEDPTTLSWRSGGGTVTGYDVYLDTLAAPVNLVSSNQSDTMFDPDPPLLANRTYYWKIVPRNGSGAATASCTITSFTTLALPPCATSLSPANGAAAQSIATTLSWATGGGTVTGYDIYFGTTTPPQLVVSDHPTTTYNPGTLLAGTTYYWKIAPGNGSGSATTCSIISFTTLASPPCATSLAPANGATGLALTTTLSWASGGSPVATGYDVYFGTNATPPLVSGNQAGLTYNPGTLLAGTAYYWQIVPRNASGPQSGCAIVSFTTLAVPPCAINLAPANGATSQVITTTLTWATGGGTVTGYDVYFGTAVSPPLMVTGQAGTTYNPGTLVAGTTYNWKIVPKNSSGTATGCSVVSFTTLPLPVCASNFSPANGAAGVAITSTLSWSSGGAPTPTGYDVYFGTASSPPLVVTNQAGTTYNPGTLAQGTTYYYKIVPRNSSGLATGCSVNSFITIFPGVPVCAINLSPANGASGLATNQTLSWSSGGTPAPTSYDVYLSTSQALVASSSPGALVVNQAGTTYSPSLAAGTTYYWRIIARNAAGVAAGCSIFQFTTFGPVNYDVTRSTGISYSSISGSGNHVNSWRGGVNTDDNLSDTVSLGFNFLYQGTVRSKLLISTNGFITFNTGTASIGDASGAAYGPDNQSFTQTGATGSTQALAPLYDDLVCQGSSFQQLQLDNTIKYLMTGTSPNRIFTVEWISMEKYQNPGPDLNFQVKLYESSNNIEFVYGTMQGFDGTRDFNYNYSLGLNAATITAPHPAGELLTQQIYNTRSFGNAPANGLAAVPECSSSLLFTPGNYTPYVPGSNTVTNDDPAGAITLASNTSPCVTLCGTYYSSVGATNTNTVPMCTQIPGADVWFKFIATSPSTTIKVRASGDYDPVVELLDNSLNDLVCQNTPDPGMTETISTTSLVTGNNYYVRVYHFWGGSATTGQFSICINATPAKPVNDSCLGAIQLFADTALIPVNGTNTTVATFQASAPAPCNSTNADDDVWYSFLAPAPSATVVVQGSGTFMPAVQIFSGSCSSLTTLQCVTGPGQTKTAFLSGLTPNTNYYIRVYHAGVGAANGTFTIGITSQKPGCPTVFDPPTGTQGVPLGGTILRWNKGFNASGYDVYLDTINPPVRRIAYNVSDTTYYSGPLGTVPQDLTFYWTVVSRNAVDTSDLCYVNLFAPSLTDLAMKLRLFIEGFYLAGTGTMNAVLDPEQKPDVTDSITVTLYDTVYFAPMFTYKTELSTTGYALCIFPSEAGGSYYYIGINHRNSVETWTRTYFYDTSDTLVDLTSPPDTTNGGRWNGFRRAPAGQRHEFNSGDLMNNERELLYLRNRVNINDVISGALNSRENIIDRLALIYLSIP